MYKAVGVVFTDDPAAIVVVTVKVYYHNWTQGAAVKIRYDAEVDVLYIEIRALKPGTAECRELMSDITADYGPDGKLAGLEILDASQVLGEDAHKVVLELAPVASTATT